MTEIAITAKRVAWLPLALLVGCVFAFDQLFFQRSLGVNLLLFVLLIMGVVVQRVGWKSMSTASRYSSLATLLSAAMVVVHNSALACTITVLSLILFTALAHEPALRSLPYASLQAFANWLYLPLAALKGAGALMRGHGSTRVGWRWGGLAIAPLLLAFLFMQLYRVGNPKFEKLTAGFLSTLGQAIADFINWLFAPQMLFITFGSIVCSGLMFRFAPKLVPQWEAASTDLLVRVRRRRPRWMAPLAMDPLERERRMGLVLLVLVNALLLVVNIIDIDWVWFRFEVPRDFSLKQFVHEGTWILIASILLSMLLILFLFRGSLNFYARSNWLKRMALLWIAQNVVLGVSVFLRNFHYIGFHGLAYKRVGVIVFVLLVLIGLVTLYIKVKDRRTLYYLVRVNTWAALVVLTTMTTVDWDSFIVRSNLRHSNPGEIDIDNYLAMSDKVLPLLYADLDLVEKQMEQHRNNRVRWVETLQPDDFRSALDAKRDRFLLRKREQHWQEWNLADDRTLRALSGQHTPARP